MSLSAATICLMVEMGLSAEQISRLALAIEQDGGAAQAPKRSANAERQARYRDRKARENESATNNVTGNVTGDAQHVTSPPPALDKEIPPTPPKEINPNPNTLSHPQRERVDEARQRLAEVKGAAGDALADMATTQGVATLQALTALLRETPPCDWHLDVLPAVTAAAAWHRQRDGSGGMKTWTLAVKLSRENRSNRLNPPRPVEPTHVRGPSASTPADRRRAQYDERLEDFGRAAEAAVRESRAASRG